MKRICRVIWYAGIMAGFVIAVSADAIALCEAPVPLSPKGGVVQSFDSSGGILLRIAYSADAPEGKRISDCPWLSTTWQVADDPSKFFDIDAHRFATDFAYLELINKKARANLITQVHALRGSGGAFGLLLVRGQINPGQRVFWRARINFAVKVSGSGIIDGSGPATVFSSPFSDIASFEVSRVLQGNCVAMHTPAVLFPERTALFRESELLSFEFRIWEPLEDPCTWDQTEVEFTPRNDAGDPQPNKVFSLIWRRPPQMASGRHAIHMTQRTPRGRYTWRARAIHVRKDADLTRVRGPFTSPADLRIGSPTGLPLVPAAPGQPSTSGTVDADPDRLQVTVQPVTALVFCRELPTPAPLATDGAAKGASATIALRVKAGNFDSPCTIDATEWQVTDATTGQLAYQTGFSAADLTGASVPRERLQQGATYTWRARFKSAGSGFGGSDVLSNWSTPTPLAFP